MTEMELDARKQKEMDKKLDRILFYLEDDHTTGRVGIAHLIEKMDDRVKALEDDKKMLRGIAAFFGVLGSLIGWALYVVIGVKGK